MLAIIDAKVLEHNGLMTSLTQATKKLLSKERELMKISELLIYKTNLYLTNSAQILAPS